ncbi:M14 family metallopeptidase [Svornostia abyssi]|uniref:M14 family metallopeptidase n=1 Tax=Svornostia abyssi TaxID=2898438 RepID=A0ABY5PLQ1_9ACTN|nr:M14 family metallopeptidase [Parviterribacteraceae bacterium J379]
MKRTSAVITSMLAAAAVAAGPAQAAPPALDVYTGEVTQPQLAEIVGLGIDRHELDVSAIRGERGAKAKVRVETILSAQQARALEREGIELAPKEIGGDTVAQRATALAADGLSVFKKYAGPGGLKAEFEQAAKDHPRLTKLVSYGKTVNGQDIVALKVSKNARSERDGRKPAVLYLGAQHAREWITPEMVRRLMQHVLAEYESNRAVRRLVDENELWFVPVANPDGYDYTFEPGQRLWRKNLRDNNGDGQITPGDGVDLNRNNPTKWGYDNEGSSPDPASETFRGLSPGSEPETKALDRFVGRVGFEFFVNYHSAAELLLYGTGWQVATPTPDDVIYETLAGDDANPAVPGYDPDLSAELYTTNGDTDTHMTEEHRTLGFTPEMSTCEAASDSVPDDEWNAADCGSGFEFPDDEELVQAEFEKNIPFALSVAKSAKDPADPVSVVGRRADDFRVDSFDVSYGDPQQVAVVAKRELRAVRMQYRINGGRTRTAPGEGVARRRALRRRERRLLRRAARHRPRDRSGRQGPGVVHRREAGPRLGRQHDVHLHGEVRHGRRRAGPRRRGLHGREPDVPGRDERAEVRGRARRGDRGRRLRRRRLGRRRAGRAARPRRARPLRRRRLVPRRQPPDAGPGG